MPEEISDAVLDKVKHFTIGFAGETPAAKGSGVLIKHGELHGILTCAHVDKYLRKLKQPVGLVRLNRGLAQQFGTLNMGEVFSYAAGEEPWTKGDDDIAFIHLPPHLVGISTRKQAPCLARCGLTPPGVHNPAWQDYRAAIPAMRRQSGRALPYALPAYMRWSRTWRPSASA